MIDIPPYKPDDYSKTAFYSNYCDNGYFSSEKPIDTYVKSKIKLKRNISYSFEKNIFSLNQELENIVNCIKKSENILSLDNNWDEMGSPKISTKTWVTIVKFLIDYSTTIHKNYGYIIDTPKIYPSLNGSIDIDWETETYGFMINFEKGGEKATYYADDKHSQMSQGVFNPKKTNFNILPKAISF